MTTRPLTPPLLVPLVVAVMAVSPGCDRDPAREADRPAARPSAAREAPAAPAERRAPSAPAAGRRRGTVQETLPGGSYTYMRLEENGEQVWVAAMSMPVSAGDRVEFTGMVMRDFHSSTLDRTFEQIVFADHARVLGGSEPAADEAPSGPAPPLPPGHPPINRRPAPAAGGPAPDGPAHPPGPLAPGQTELPPGHPSVAP